MAQLRKRHRNPHHGTDFATFLREDGLEAQVVALALKKTLSVAFSKRMKARKVTVSALARRLRTSRAVIQRALDPTSTALTLRTLCRLAAALDCRVGLAFADL